MVGNALIRLFAIALIALASVPVAAQTGPRGYAWAEAAVFVEQDHGPRVTTISPLVGADYTIAELVEVRARFGWVGLRLDDDGFSHRRWRWSNLELGASYRHEIATYYPFVFELSVGVDLALPTSRSADEPHFYDVVDESLLWQASAMRGRRDPWLWSPDTFGVVVPLAAQLVHDYAHLKLGLDVGTMIAIDESDARVVFQFLGEAGYRVQRKLLLALALSVLSSPSNDDVAVAGAFRSVAELDPVRLHLDIWLNLDDPTHFSLAGSRWGVVVGMGIALP